MKSAHRAAEDLVRDHAASQLLPKGSGARIAALDALVTECPCYYPALVDLARQIQLSDEPEEVTSPRASLAEAGGLLARAVEVSRHAADALTERAYFVDVLDDRPQEAERVFRDAVRRARRDLEDAWVGLIKVLLEQENLSEARAELERATVAFPGSVGFEELLEELRRAREQA